MMTATADKVVDEVDYAEITARTCATAIGSVADIGAGSAVDAAVSRK